VGEHCGDKDRGRPVVHLAQQQTAANIERQIEGRRVRVRHVQSAEQLVAALVFNLGHRGLEPNGQKDAAEQQNDERIQCDFAE
jgi:hypothetical protein